MSLVELASVGPVLVSFGNGFFGQVGAFEILPAFGDAEAVDPICGGGLFQRCPFFWLEQIETAKGMDRFMASRADWVLVTEGDNDLAKVGVVETPNGAGGFGGKVMGNVATYVRDEALDFAKDDPAHRRVGGYAFAFGFEEAGYAA